jgi:predicted acyl esterase
MTATTRTSANSELLTGVFAGPVTGLKYQTPTVRGLTNDRGEFTYRDGEAVTFLIGRLALGTTLAAPRVNLAELVPRVDGNIGKLHDAGVTNLARLLQTLDQHGDGENGVTLAPAVHDIVGSRVIDFEQFMQAMKGADPEASFATDPHVLSLLADLNAADDVFTAAATRELRGAAAARNELRRHIRGIVKMTDVKIPVRDGSWVYADVFRPAVEGTYPVIMNKGFYGKAFNHDCICDASDAVKKEQLEDQFFSGNPAGLQYENHESVNTSDWVPHGYVVIRVDARGIGKSPGLQAPLGRQEAEDYYDAIEWAAAQPWSNGNVGLWGMSYYAMSQHNVASLRPPHLKAMIAMGTDADSYNEYLYAGGLFSEGFWNWWWKALTAHNWCGHRRETDWMANALAHPFNDPEVYGPHATTFMTPELDQATAPVWIVGTQAGAVLHQLGSSETFIHATGVKSRKFDLLDAWFPNSYQASTVTEHMRYFDYWLKGIDNGIMDEPPVRVQVRTGNGSYYELHEAEWPIGRTQYVKFYLDAAASAWSGDEHGQEVLQLSSMSPDQERSAQYDAHLDLGQPIPAPTGRVGGTPRWTTGVSFVSEPLDEDMLLLGYMKAGLWVSSTSSDMDVHVSLRVIDAEDREIRYEAVVLPMDPNHIHPVGSGVLKASHRKLDSSRSTEYWPVHTHTESDYAPLLEGEIVPVEVGLNPSSALVRKGCRLRLDLQPISPAGLPARAYDESYHAGATNTVYTGPDHPSFVQLPLVAA